VVGGEGEGVVVVEIGGEGGVVGGRVVVGAGVGVFILTLFHTFQHILYYDLTHKL
jgi:hypothetical protein